MTPIADKEPGMPELPKIPYRIDVGRDGSIRLYNAAQVANYGSATEAWARADERRKVLEEAIEACRRIGRQFEGGPGEMWAERCEIDIRALIDHKEPTT